MKALHKTMSWGDQMSFPVSGRIKSQRSVQQERKNDSLVFSREKLQICAVYTNAVICANCQDQSTACLLELG